MKKWAIKTTLCSASSYKQQHITTATHTHIPFNGPLSGTTRVSRYQKGKTNLHFTGADFYRQWHQLGRMQVTTSLQTDNHANTQPLSFLQAGCPSCRPTNSVKALKANITTATWTKMWQSDWVQKNRQRYETNFLNTRIKYHYRK